MVQGAAKRFQTPDALFFTVFSYFICGANSKNKHYEQSIRRNFQAAGKHRKDDFPVVGTQPNEQDEKEPVLVKISVASSITGYSVNYLYHLAASGAIPCVKRGRSLRFDMDELKRWMQQQYVPAYNRLSDEKEKR